MNDNVYCKLYFFRSIILSIQYSQSYSLEGFFLTNWFVGAFQVLLLCFALNYQRKFRSTGLFHIFLLSVY